MLQPPLPATAEEAKTWTWEDNIKPYFDDLQSRELTPETIDEWMTDWTDISRVLGEVSSRARTATTQNTADEEAEAFLKHLLGAIFPPVMQAGNGLNKKLVESGLEPENFELPLKKMRADIELFREENIPLVTKDQETGMEYGKITGAHVVEWEGEEVTFPELEKVLEDDDRATREKAWCLMMDRWLEDREAINDVWVRLFDLRNQMATNADLPDYRAYQWRAKKRFDYTAEDCQTFHDSIEQVVVPAAKRIYERRQERLGLDTLRPWDLDVDTSGKAPMRPWETLDDFVEKAQTVFNNVDPALGEYFATMRHEDLYDLPNRKNKRPGAYCTSFPLIKRPFVFMNAVGTREDVATLLHEFGHAFHGFEVLENLRYVQQMYYPIEFAEVASMAMELLAAPYLTQEQGGYFSAEEAARDRIAHLEKIVRFWPYMAVVDGFQQWAYTHVDAAKDPANCDAKWGELWDRFMVGIDYSGFEDTKVTGWHRKQHIYLFPFYYVEYGLAQLGAVQVWANALENQAEAVAAYRRGLALGGTKSIPELFATAGANFAFDVDTMQRAVDLIESTIDELEA